MLRRVYLILSFRLVLYVICFLLGNFPASEFNSDTGKLPKRKHITRSVYSAICLDGTRTDILLYLCYHHTVIFGVS